MALDILIQASFLRSIFVLLRGDTQFFTALPWADASPLRGRSMAALAGGSATDNEGEMGFDALDNVSVAGARFDWIQRRLRSE